MTDKLFPVGFGIMLLCAGLCDGGYISLWLAAVLQIIGLALLIAGVNAVKEDEHTDASERRNNVA